METWVESFLRPTHMKHCSIGHNSLKISLIATLFNDIIDIVHSLYQRQRDNLSHVILSFFP